MADIFQIIENNGTPKSIEDRKARTNIAPYFEANNANAAGDLVLSDTGVLYRFNTAYTAGTSWSSRTSKEQVNLAEIKAPLDSPAFTGIPTAPTAAAGTSNTQIATTAYADNAIIPINSSINAIDSSLAIVSDGDTHIALSNGQYVYVKNHSSLAEGLYTANSAIGANVALTSSNVTRVQENGTDIGGLNDLKSIQLKYTDFVIQQHILRESVTLSAYGILEIVSEPVTKTGSWYPLTISGFSYTGWATQYVYPFSMRMSDQQIGSATVIFRLKNTYNGEIPVNGVSLNILWMRVN